MGVYIVGFNPGFQEKRAVSSNREGRHGEPIAPKTGLARGLVVENQHGVCSARTSMVT